MKILYWNDVISSAQNEGLNEIAAQGCGISVGSFDGLHKGHRVLIKTLVDQCDKNQLLPGVVTFTRPLPSIKHSSDYSGDISTLDQRLKLLEELGVAFAVVVDFDQDFAARSGIQFFELLIKKCNLKLIAEGVDFRCGYKGATDTQAIRYFCQQNNIESFFVSPVYYRPGTEEEERISSSYIRMMIKKGFLATVEELLERKYELDFTGINTKADVNKSELQQVLPPDGVYHCKNENGAEVRVQITGDVLKLGDVYKVIKF